MDVQSGIKEIHSLDALKRDTKAFFNLYVFDICLPLQSGSSKVIWPYFRRISTIAQNICRTALAARTKIW